MITDLKTPRAFRFKDLLRFLLCVLLVLGRFTVCFGLWDDRLFDSSCCVVSQLYSSAKVAKSPALAYSLEENDQAKNNFGEFMKS